MLIESCKTLNLNFNMNHQNDATEFYDQLLERLETAMKGQGCFTNSWNDLKTQILGGKCSLKKYWKSALRMKEINRLVVIGNQHEKKVFWRLSYSSETKKRLKILWVSWLQLNFWMGTIKLCVTLCSEEGYRSSNLFWNSSKSVSRSSQAVRLRSTSETVKLNNHTAFPTKLDMFPRRSSPMRTMMRLQRSN